MKRDTGRGSLVHLVAAGLAPAERNVYRETE